MKGKAKRRKHEDGKDTVFNFGGRLWDTDRIDSTLARVERSRLSESLAGEFPINGLLPQTSSDSPSD